jgi:hypothetical protein
MKRLFCIRVTKAFTALGLAAAVLFSPLFSGFAAAAPSYDEMVSAFKADATKYYSDTGFSTNRYKYTESEVKMLAIVIHMEARGEPYRCKLAIGNVIMNRVLSPGYPGATIKEVVTRPNQFCYKPNVKPSAECMRAARDVLEREVWVVPQNTYFFKVYRSKANWGRHTFYTRMGGTAFYRDSYAGRFNGSNVPAALYERVYKWPQYGCKAGQRVRKLQSMLAGLGYDVAVDGHFGVSTKIALVNFQKSRGLAADGIAGPATIHALIKKYGINSYLKL